MISFAHINITQYARHWTSNSRKVILTHT